MNQLAMELKYASHNQGVALEKYKEYLMEPVNQAFEEYLDDWIEQSITREDLQEIIPEVMKLDIAWDILTTVLFEGRMSLQSIIGRYWEQIDVSKDFRKGRVLEPFIHAVESSPYIELKQGEKYLELVATKHVKPTEHGYVLPALYPEEVKSNSDAGYQTVNFHVITGGKLKQHDGEKCLDHINRSNHNMYKIETRLGFMVQPEFDDTPKFKKGAYETEPMIEERRKDFNRFVDELPSKRDAIIREGNKFCYKHRYDTRGRTYAKAYHFDYIGNKYIRALVQPVTGELVLGSDKYNF